MARITRISSSRRRLILAILAGAAAALLMFFYAGSLKEQANAAQRAAIEEYGGSRTEVLVATRDILAGEELSAANTTMKPWLADLLPSGSITDPNDVYGLTLAVPVWNNEPILSVKLGGGSEHIQVPDGLSAVSIPISDDMAVGGSLLPGSSVDVYAIGASQVRLVLADVLVLEASNGIGLQQNSSAAQSGVVLGGSSRAALKWVTLAVRDESVAELLHAARDNTLCLVLPGQNAGAALQQLGDDETGASDALGNQSTNGTGSADGSGTGSANGNGNGSANGSGTGSANGNGATGVNESQSDSGAEESSSATRQGGQG